MPKPPIRELILDDLLETIRGIRVAAGYATDVKQVNRFQTGKFKGQLPAASVYDVAEVRLNGPWEVESRALSVVVEGWLRGTSPERFSTELNYFLADIVAAVTRTPQRGGNAVNTLLMDVTTQLEDAGESGLPLGILQVQFDIHYRYLFGKPATPGC